MKAQLFTIFHKLMPVFFLALSLLPVQAQKMVPDAPIRNFQLPMYGADGYRIWLLEGFEGLYVNAEQVNVLGMKLYTYSGDEEMRDELLISSPDAVIHLSENRAEGRILRVKGDGFHLSGKDWEWDGNARRVTINREAVVKFKQNLNTLLK